jgi:hypothetical protein
MRRALRILSILTLVSLATAILAQALTYVLGIAYDPSGQPINPTSLNVAVTYAGSASIVAWPLTIATLVVGVMVIGDEGRIGWLVALAAAGALAFAGMFAMARVILSGASPIAFQTPFVGIPLVTLLYGFTLCRAPHDQQRLVGAPHGCPNATILPTFGQWFGCRTRAMALEAKSHSPTS